jgi:hypothetical protein
MIQLIAIITEEQKSNLLNQQFTKGNYYNPFQDFNDNWCITKIEIDNTTNKDFLWVKDLELSELNPKIYTLT